MLLEAWKEFEKKEGDDVSRKSVENLMPRRVKKRRKVTGEDGSDQGWEEYFDYIFPEDEAAKPNLKLLAMAKMWKKQKEHAVEDPTEVD
jgi:crooked neck